jgi:hypothetical protein
MTLSITGLCHYAECRVLFIVTLNVIVLNVIMLNVIVLNVNKLNVIMLNVIMLNVIMLNVIMLNVAILKVVTLNVVMLDVIMLKVVMLNMILLKVVMLNVVMLSALAQHHPHNESDGNIIVISLANPTPGCQAKFLAFFTDTLFARFFKLQNFTAWLVTKRFLVENQNYRKYFYNTRMLRPYLS